jgi:hypothetical protein
MERVLQVDRHAVWKQSLAGTCGFCLAAVVAVAFVLGPATVTRAAPPVRKPLTWLPAANGAVSALSGDAQAEAPVVALDQLPLRSNDTTPSFSGTASDSTTVTIEVFRGESAEGEPVVTLKARGTGGSWVSADVFPPLENGMYTAIARQSSSQGTGTGTSNAVSFEIDTESPTVTLAAPRSPSNDLAPSFAGSASDATPVTVEIYQGPSPEGKLVATAEASGTRAGWISGPATPALESGDHTFTAVAVQASEVGNDPGKSAPVTFVVDTEAPKVTLEMPPSSSNDPTPSFSGTTSEAGEITVEIFVGPAPQGTPLQTVSVNATGRSWSSRDVESPLLDGTYTAIATQPSAIENPAGRSAPVTFTVDTSAPTVTLNTPLSPSANKQPSFSGTASDHTPVTIEVHSGSSAGPVVGSLIAEPNRGVWVSGKASELPGWGSYTAVAIQPSSIGNPDGKSPPVTFAVEPIAPAAATEASASITRTSAALYASVDPKGAGVEGCRFEYGTTTAYGKSVGCGFVSGISAFPPAGIGAEQVFARIYGLSPSSTYHFRIVAVGEGGTADGADQAFTTLPPWLFNEGAPLAPAVTPGPAGGAQGTASYVARHIAGALTPRGRAARIAALLTTGAFRALFTAPGAGRVVIVWYYTPARARAKRSARSPVIVAAGTASFHAPDTAPIMIRVTAAGRRLLRAARHLRLSAACVFIPRAGARIRVSAVFQLSR